MYASIPKTKCKLGTVVSGDQNLRCESHATTSDLAVTAVFLCYDFKPRSLWVLPVSWSSIERWRTKAVSVLMPHLLLSEHVSVTPFPFMRRKCDLSSANLVLFTNHPHVVLSCSLSLYFYLSSSQIALLPLTVLLKSRFHKEVKYMVCLSEFDSSCRILRILSFFLKITSEAQHHSTACMFTDVYPFIGWWPPSRIPCPIYCQQGYDKHGSENSSTEAGFDALGISEVVQVDHTVVLLFIEIHPCWFL